MSPLFIGIAAFVAVTALVGFVATQLLRTSPEGKMEDRLDLLTGVNTSSAGKGGLAKQQSVLAEPLDDRPDFVERALSRFGNVRLLCKQADTSLTMSRLMIVATILAVVGAGLGAATGLHLALLPVLALVMACLPIIWLWLRRKRRLKRIAVQLPDAMEMLARSLRSGQSLQAGFDMIANEMGPPVGKEFARVFEEQNLGIPLDESLKEMTNRVPNLDLKFFSTAVILQRQTGGDLAEILDKIGLLIRQRFQIWGQVQALTGEGRLSGVVLLALPVALAVALYYLNRDYLMMLFTDELGNKMLGLAIVLQLLGAVVIRKIVNIKV